MRQSKVHSNISGSLLTPPSLDAIHECSIQPAECDPHVGEEFLTWSPTLAMDFCDFEFVYTDEEQERGLARFVMNEYTKRLYPEDDVYGTSWMGMPGRKL